MNTTVATRAEEERDCDPQDAIATNGEEQPDCDPARACANREEQDTDNDKIPSKRMANFGNSRKSRTKAAAALQTSPTL